GIHKTAVGTHSDYVSLITDYGLPLTCVYFGIIVSLYRRLLAAVRNRTQQAGSFAVVASWSLFLFLVVNQVGHNMFQGPVYFLVLAVATGTFVPRPVVEGRVEDSAH